MIVIQASFYALLGMGYVLIYRATRVLNLAHGDLMVFGAFLFFQAWWSRTAICRSSVIAGLAGAAVLGALIYLGIMRPLAGYPVAVGVLATIALGILLRSIATSIWSGQTRYPAEYLGQLGRPIEMMPGLSISGIDIAIIAAALVAMARLSVVAAAGRGRRGDAGRGREPAAGGAARHQYSQHQRTVVGCRYVDGDRCGHLLRP